MRIIDVNMLPEPGNTQPVKRRNRTQRYSSFDNVWSPNPQAKRPTGFPATNDPLYPDAANAYIHVLSTSLLNAQFHGIDTHSHLPTSAYEQDQLEVNAGRLLISPAVLNDADLRRYVEKMAPYALGSSELSRIPPQSPLIAPYLMGGITNMAFEELCERVLAVCEFPEELVKPTFNDALCCVGFGSKALHVHQDSVRAEVVNREKFESDYEYADRITRLVKPSYAPKGYLSARQQWLIDKIPEGAFCTRLMRQGAYDESLMRKVSRMKWEVCQATALQFIAEPGTPGVEMTQLARDRLEAADGYVYAQATYITDITFMSAVERVFARPWLELDLSGDPHDLVNDVEKVMARLIIKNLTGGGNRSLKTTVKLSARTIVAMSLLTGVPLGKWIRFALEDFARRGETFIDQRTIEAIFDLVYSSELMVHFTAAEELEGYKFRLGAWDLHEETPAVARFAHKLRTGTHLLWSTRGTYHLSYEARSLRETSKWTPPRDSRLIGCPSRSPYTV